MKRCPHCGKTKPLDEYHKNGRQPDGRQSWCKVCARAAARKNNLAVHRALARLKIRHRREYDELLAQERAKL